jgi:hypothetical protein
MGTKTRGVLIGIICAVVVIAGLLLLSQGETSFHAKYEGVDLSTDVEALVAPIPTTAICLPMPASAQVPKW